ncbi:MAG: hypothetical protein NTZ16_09715 [Verrucomicrobia bacterium]|nr:hypothetical protein [Verrucomicrobiota bacterium]
MMKTNRYFSRTNRREATVVPTAPFRGVTEVKLERLKEQLLAEELRRATAVDLGAPLRLAAEEAAALAWLTPYPLLLLPALLEEKALAARRKAGRQAQIRHRSSGLLTLAE